MTPADAKRRGAPQIERCESAAASIPKSKARRRRPGIEIGDIIVTAAGKPVDQVSPLQRIIRGFKPGDVVDLDVMRFGQKKTFKVQLGEPTRRTAAVARTISMTPRRAP